MSELDELNEFKAVIDEYNRVQLRQTLDFFKGVSDLLGTDGNPEKIIELFIEFIIEPIKTNKQ